MTFWFELYPAKSSSKAQSLQSSSSIWNLSDGSMDGQLYSKGESYARFIMSDLIAFSIGFLFPPYENVLSSTFSFSQSGLYALSPNFDISKENLPLEKPISV